MTVAESKDIDFSWKVGSGGGALPYGMAGSRGPGHPLTDPCQNRECKARAMRGGRHFATIRPRPSPLGAGRLMRGARVQTILVANPKGGSGKTTLATNVAGWLAGKRQRVVLEDRDPQQSAMQWLQRRPRLFPTVIGVGADARKKDLEALEAQWLVVDSPAGLHGDELRTAIKMADVMLVPVSPSSFDMAATERFLRVIADAKAVKGGGLAIGLVGMRVDSRTRSAGELENFLTGFEHPLVTHLRDTQIYVYCARDGACVFELPRSRAERDWEQWRPLTRWIARHAAVRAG
jgi:chromosome partitioning protein